jgi:hypothetical protein
VSNGGAGDSFLELVLIHGEILDWAAAILLRRELLQGVIAL